MIFHCPKRLRCLQSSYVLFFSLFHVISFHIFPSHYRCRYFALLVVSLVCYIATFGLSGFLFYFFTSSDHDCGLNTFFIIMNLIFVLVFAIVTLHPAVSIQLCSCDYRQLLTFWSISLSCRLCVLLKFKTFYGLKVSGFRKQDLLWLDVNVVMLMLRR